MNKKSFLSILVVILTYSIFRYMKNSPSMPPINTIAKSAGRIITSTAFYSNFLYTIKIVLIGIAISFVAGTLIAILCSMNNLAYNLIMPIINSTKNIPSIALFPLFIVLMGIGDAPRVFVIIWNSIYPIISSTMAGLDSVDRDVIEAAQNCGATKKDLYLYIKIPLSTIHVLEGLKISLGNGFIAIVVAEMLGATKGLGYMILWSANTFKYPEMYFYILVVALIGLIINVAIEKLIKFIEKEMYYEESSKHVTNDSSDGDCTRRVWNAEQGKWHDQVRGSESL